MMDLCTKCDDRDDCEKLCLPAELWAGQDHVHQDTNLVYISSEKTLEYLDFWANLNLAEMQTDVTLGIQEWHYVKNCGLTDQQMQCVWLYYWEKFTQKKVAKILSISEPTVHKHLKYAKKKLVKVV